MYWKNSEILSENKTRNSCIITPFLYLGGKKVTHVKPLLKTLLWVSCQPNEIQALYLGLKPLHYLGPAHLPSLIL